MPNNGKRNRLLWVEGCVFDSSSLVKANVIHGKELHKHSYERHHGTAEELAVTMPLDAILATAEKKSLHRSLGAFQLTMLGIGAVIGTGIFVLTAAAAQKAGPGMMFSFVIAGFVCAVAALCYSELASMVPVSGSAYTYTYAVMGELLAWMVGWALILEYAVAASAV